MSNRVPPAPQQHFDETPIVHRGGWEPRPPHPVVSFGIGGQLLVMIPRTPRVFSNMVGRKGSAEAETTEEREQPSLVGPIRIYQLRQLLADTPHLQSLLAFPGPLSANTASPRIAQFLDAQVAQTATGMFLFVLTLLHPFVLARCLST